MRDLLRTRALPFAAVFAALFVVNGAATAAVFSRGYGFTLGAAGAALSGAFAVALAALSGAALRRWKGLGWRDAGLRPGRGFLPRLAGFAGAGALAVGVVAALLVGTGAGALTWVGLPAWVAGLGLLAFPLTSALQQVGLQSLCLAARPPGGMTAGAAALPLALFVAAHAAQSLAPLYLLNVALFGAATVLLFFGEDPPSYAAPVGLHGGWNAAMMLLGLLPGSEGLTAFTWAHRGPAWWSGGAAGPEGGAAYTLVALAAVGASAARARRRGAR